MIVVDNDVVRYFWNTLFRHDPERYFFTGPAVFRMTMSV